MKQPNDYDTNTVSTDCETAFKQDFVEDAATGRIRFNAKGFAEYGPRFAKAGIDINQIKTLGQLKDACARSDDVLAAEIREMVKGHKELEEILKPLWS